MKRAFEWWIAPAVHIVAFVVFHMGLRLLLYFLLGQHRLGGHKRFDIWGRTGWKLVERVKIASSRLRRSKLRLQWYIRTLLPISVHWTNEPWCVDPLSPEEQIVIEGIVNRLQCWSLWQAAHVKLFIKRIGQVFRSIAKRAERID
jgi:hypothetical protein